MGWKPQYMAENFLLVSKKDLAESHSKITWDPITIILSHAAAIVYKKHGPNQKLKISINFLLMGTLISCRSIGLGWLGWTLSFVSISCLLYMFLLWEAGWMKHGYVRHPLLMGELRSSRRSVKIGHASWSLCLELLYSPLHLYSISHSQLHGQIPNWKGWK